MLCSFNNMPNCTAIQAMSQMQVTGIDLQPGVILQVRDVQIDTISNETAQSPMLGQHKKNLACGRNVALQLKALLSTKPER